MLNQIGGAGADDVRPQNAISFSVGNNFHQAVGVVGGHGATAGSKRKGANVIGLTGGFDLLFGAADRGDFGVSINDVGNDIVVQLRLVAGDALRHHHPLFRAFVGQHWSAHQIADRPDAWGISGALIVDKHTAALVSLYTAISGQQTIGVGATANTDNQFVEGFRVLATVVALVGDNHLTLGAAAFDLCTHDPSAEANIEPLLGEDLLGLFGYRFIHNRQEIVQSFKQHHL